MISSVAALMLMALWGGAAPEEPPGETKRLRTESVAMRSLIEGAMARSGTMRRLVDRLNRTDAIVYVEITSAPLVPTARTKLVATVPGARFIRISINVGWGDRDRVALLAHELQHAVEIAEQHDVRDDDGVRRLYDRIGRSYGADSYETEAAREVEWTVRAEIRNKIGG